jgi:hypothetical protein
MKRYGYFLLFMLMITTSIACSKRTMEAIEVHKLHDEFFFLRKNGRYSVKVSVMGMMKMPDSEHGRYIISNDTVYFVTKSKKNIFRLNGFGIIDTAAQQFYYKPNDTASAKIYSIMKMQR